jgi:hypothetical protein
LTQLVLFKDSGLKFTKLLPNFLPSFSGCNGALS